MCRISSQSMQVSTRSSSVSPSPLATTVALPLTSTPPRSLDLTVHGNAVHIIDDNSTNTDSNDPLPRHVSTTGVGDVPAQNLSSTSSLLPSHEPSKVDDVDAAWRALVPPFGDRVRFRPMRAGDLSAVRALDEVLFPVRYNDKFYRSLVRYPYVTIIGVMAVDELDEVERKAGLQLTEDGMVLVALVTARLQEVSDVLCGSRREGYIATFGVSPAFRMRGLGSAVLSRMLRLLQERHHCASAALHVTTSNHAALALYDTFGFQLVEMLSKHYFFHEGYHDAYHLELWFERGRTDTCCIL